MAFGEASGNPDTVRRTSGLRGACVSGRRIPEIERIPRGRGPASKATRKNPVSIVLQSGLIAAGAHAPAGPHHLGGPELCIGFDLIEKIAEWCARQVEDLVPSGELAVFEETLSKARAYSEAELWREPPPRVEVPEDGCRPRRLNALAVAAFCGAIARRRHGHPRVRERMVARAVGFTVELLERRADGERVRRFLLDLDRELILGDAKTFMRRAGAHANEQRITEVVARGGWLSYGSIHRWLLLRMRAPGGGETAMYCVGGWYRLETVIEARPAELFARIRASEKPDRDRWSQQMSGWQSAGTVSRTITLQRVSAAVLALLVPARAELVVGLLRLISQPAVGDGCAHCAGLWHARNEQPRECRFCKAVFDAGVRESLPPLEMIASEVQRTMNVTEGPDGPLAREVFRWCAAASHPLPCPMCNRRDEPTVPTAQGWICRSCLIIPLMAQHAPRRARVDLEAAVWAEPPLREDCVGLIGWGHGG